MHVSTQLPYAVTVAAVSIVGFLVAGFSGGNLLITYAVAVPLLVFVLLGVHWWQRMHAVPAKEMEVEMADLKKKEDEEKAGGKPEDNEEGRLETEIAVVV